MTNVSLESFEDRKGERVRVNFEHEGESKTLETKFLFNALGRQPATANLRVDKVGIELRSSGQGQGLPSRL